MKEHVEQQYPPLLHCKRSRCQLDPNAPHNQVINFHKASVYQGVVVGIVLSMLAEIIQEHVKFTFLAKNLNVKKNKLNLNERRINKKMRRNCR